VCCCKALQADVVVVQTPNKRSFLLEGCLAGRELTHEAGSQPHAAGTAETRCGLVAGDPQPPRRATRRAPPPLRIALMQGADILSLRARAAALSKEAERLEEEADAVEADSSNAGRSQGGFAELPPLYLRLVLQQLRAQHGVRAAREAERSMCADWRSVFDPWCPLRARDGHQLGGRDGGEGVHDDVERPGG